MTHKYYFPAGKEGLYVGAEYASFFIHPNE